MNIATSILTYPRPGSTYSRALRSLADAGFDRITTYDKVHPEGAFSALLASARQLLAASLDADAYFLVEDDVVFCRGLRSYLDDWPVDPATIAFLSPYCPEVYANRFYGWHPQSPGWNLCSAHSWLIPAGQFRRMIQEVKLLPYGDGDRQFAPGDATVGKWAKENNLPILFHTPSLGQHIGNGAPGSPLDIPIRRAGDFVGETFDIVTQ